MEGSLALSQALNGLSSMGLGFGSLAAKLHIAQQPCVAWSSGTKAIQREPLGPEARKPCWNPEVLETLLIPNYVND